jgi:2-polyprenyl-6-methoxyphenol hydroxylase-like FAD-dependent oxidoreductase
VLIAGGGIGGLAAAIALREAGHEPIVFERAGEIGDVGAGIVLGRSALRVLSALGIADDVRSAGNAVSAVEPHTAGGRRLGVLGPHPKGARGLVAVHRADLLAALEARAGRGTVELGAPVTAVAGTRDDAVAVELADGRQTEGDLLIGADGLRSTIRTTHVAPTVQPRDSGVTAWRGVSEEPPTAEHAMTYAVGRGWESGACFLGRRGVYWYVEHRTPAPSAEHEGRTERDRVLALLGDRHPHIRRHVTATPADRVIRTPLFDVPSFGPWSRGRVTLLGDAAHGMLPNLGQGATQALLDVQELATRLGARGDDVHLALRRYEARRRRPSAALRRGSHLAARAVTASWKRKDG